MARKQLFALFLCSLIVWTVGNGLLPLLPAYAVHLGAAPAVVRYYLSFSYFALAAGTLVVEGCPLVDSNPAGWTKRPILKRRW